MTLYGLAQGRAGWWIYMNIFHSVRHIIGFDTYICKYPIIELVGPISDTRDAACGPAVALMHLVSVELSSARLSQSLSRIVMNLEMRRQIPVDLYFAQYVH